MNKRIAAGVLWLFAGWYLGNIVAFHVGISDLLGPILGIAAAAVVAGDPLGLIWTGSAQRVTVDRGPVTDH
ncbi:MAG: hypothetical protein ACXWWR_03925 [Candidatus Limnocylindrales bacterium]